MLVLRNNFLALILSIRNQNKRKLSGSVLNIFNYPKGLPKTVQKSSKRPHKQVKSINMTNSCALGVNRLLVVAIISPQKFKFFDNHAQRMSIDQSNSVYKHLWIEEKLGKWVEKFDTNKKAIDGCGVLQCIVKACFSNFTWQKVYQLNALDGHRTWIGLNDFVLDFIEIDYYSYIHVFYPVSYDKVSLNGNILPLSDVIAFTHVKKLQCVTSKQVSLLLCLLVCFFSVARRFFSPSWSILS